MRSSLPWGPPLLLACLLLAVGCATTKIERAQPSPGSQTQAFKYHLGLFGFWEISSPIDLNQICTQGEWSNAAIEWSPLNVVTGIATLGLYTPATVQVTCLEAKAHQDLK